MLQLLIFSEKLPAAQTNKIYDLQYNLLTNSYSTYCMNTQNFLKGSIKKKSCVPHHLSRTPFVLESKQAESCMSLWLAWVVVEIFEGQLLI